MYSAKLIKEVKGCYPNSDVMHKLADEGNVFLGRYLDDSCSNSISLDTILTSVTLGEIQDKARSAKRKMMCYRMWCNEDPRPKNLH